MLAAVISPLKSESVVTCEVAPELACSPLVAVTLVVTEAALTIDPSVGYAKAPSNATASCGASSSRVPAAGCPGTITLIAHARAVAPAERSAETADAPTAVTLVNASAMIRSGRRTSRGSMPRSAAAELLAREGAEALAGRVVRAEWPFVRVLGVGGDLLGNRPDLGGQ